MIKVATTFTGIGSPEQAIKNLGIKHKVVFGCDKDKYARQAYLANFNPIQLLDDVKTQSWDDPKLYCDLFVGGPPCQAFSISGNRLGVMDPRGVLILDYYRYVQKQRPKVFILENVPGLLTVNNGTVWQNWKLLFGRSVNYQEQMFPLEQCLGYNLHYAILNSKDFGLPQHRDRVYIVGIRGDLENKYEFPQGFPLLKRMRDILEPVEDVDPKYYLSEKGFKFVTNPNRIKKKYTQVDGDIALTLTANGNANWTGDFVSIDKLGYMNQDTQGSLVYSIDGLSPAITAAQKGYSQGYIADPIIASPAELILAGNLSGGVWDNTHEMSTRVYDPNGISPTIPTMQGGCQEPKTIVDKRIRKLTPLECHRLQGFPDDFFFNSKLYSQQEIKLMNKPKLIRLSDSQLYKQAGNSIPVAVMQAIIANLSHILNF